MRILVLTNLYPPHHAGSFDVRCQTVCEALQKRGHEIRVLTSNHGVGAEQRGQDIERRLQLNGAFDHPAATGFRELCPIEQANTRLLRETVEAYQPQAIHVWSLRGLSKSLVFTLLFSRLPVVYDVADDWIASELGLDPWLRWWNNPAGPFLSRFWRGVLELAGQRKRYDDLAPTRLMPGYDRVPEVFGPPAARAGVAPNSISAVRFDRLYFCSEALKAVTSRAGFQVDHGAIIHPGIRVELFAGVPKPQGAPVRRFLIVGRLCADSGVITALEALRILRENRVQASVSIYGRGESDYVAQLRSFVVNHQLPVEFLTISNQLRDLAGIYRQHDAFLYTAESSGVLPSTPLEAMAAALPVIAAKSSGVEEIVRHGENGFLFPLGDAAELAAQMRDLQIQPALLRQVVETAQAEVLTRFNESTMVDRIEEYLQLACQA